MLVIASAAWQSQLTNVFKLGDCFVVPSRKDKEHKQACLICETQFFTIDCNHSQILTS